jgi:[ribosomal protein S18]-alanine N-acetyltransferase
MHGLEMTVDFSGMRLTRMQLSDLDEVMQIEQVAHTHPWSKNSFLEALANYYEAWILRTASGELIGYYVQMIVLDESHLLTIAIKESMRRQHLGAYLLQQLISQSSQKQLRVVLLEVRVSNLAAIGLYESLGFKSVGRRKNYYQVTPQQREDALIMQYQISGNI